WLHADSKSMRRAIIINQRLNDSGMLRTSLAPLQRGQHGDPCGRHAGRCLTRPLHRSTFCLHRREKQVSIAMST
ncbi:MAG TPA: hypothetical protein VGN15_15090, partial [Ktedonobacteraceae bacterium]|nr:hypothetical protein [Ktedonobacteraceae bacterium]